jgi:hypothetical protein
MSYDEFFFVLNECRNPQAERSLLRKHGGYSGASRLLRFQMDPTNINSSKRFDVELPKQEKILELKLINKVDFVVVQKSCISIGKNVGA